MRHRVILGERVEDGNLFVWVSRHDGLRADLRLDVGAGSVNHHVEILGHVVEYLQQLIVRDRYAGRIVRGDEEEATRRLLSQRREHTVKRVFVVRSQGDAQKAHP
jgi:hypothetical protein